MADSDFLRDKRGEIAELRATMHCCVRCAMRYAAVRDPAAYQLSEEELEDIVAAGAKENAELPSVKEAADDVEAALGGTTEEPAPPPAEVCALCLGCLQQCVRPTAVESIAAVVRASGFEARDFSLAVSLPVQLLVRERGGWLHLQRTRTASLAEAGGGYTLIGGVGASKQSTQQEAPGASPRFDHIVDMKEALRWSITPLLARALGLAVSGSSPLIVHLNLSHPAVDAEHHELLAALVPSESAYAKNKRQRSGQAAEFDSIRAVQRALANSRADNLLRASKHCPPSPPSTPCRVSVSCERAPVTLSGRYCKYSRTLPQSAWLIDGARKCHGSVAECITDVLLPLYGATEGRFHSAGREDVDVRMLGEGRPFLVELVSPMKPFHSAEELVRDDARSPSAYRHMHMRRRAVARGLSRVRALIA